MNCETLSLVATGVACGARIRALTYHASTMSRCSPPYFATQNSPTYSLAVNTGWNNQSTGDLFPKNSPPSFVFEGARHFCLTVVPQLHALLITLRTTSARLRKHLQELRRVVQILRNRHEVSAEGHQCGAGTVVSVDRHPLEQRRKAASVEGASVLGRHRARAKQRARTSFCT